MSEASFNLVPINNLSLFEKVQMPVSIALLADGSQLVVSRYADELWDLYPHIPQTNLSQANKVINWRILLPDEKLLTDPVHSRLLESSKDFIWSLFIHPGKGRKSLKMLTLKSKVDELTVLLRWMVKNGIGRFSDLHGRTLDYVQEVRFNEYGIKRSEWAVKRFIAIIEDLHRQSGCLNDGLQSHPWIHETAYSLAGIKQNRAALKPKTALIPDFVASHLMDVALAYINTHSSRILNALDKVEESVVNLASSGCSRNEIYRVRGAAARAVGFEGASHLTNEYLHLRTACFIVIDMFSGLRLSEITSLAENCVASGKSSDSNQDLYWLQGTIYKTGIRAKRWLVPPIVRDAVLVLTRLTAPLRERLRREEKELLVRIGLSIGTEKARLIKKLDSVNKLKDRLFVAKHVTKNSIGGLTVGAANVSLKRFCANFDINGEDGQPYRLHSHQFRRTYARFIAQAELGDLLTLRDHFGHWSLDMTLCYADGGADKYDADVELLDLIAEEKLTRQTEIIGGYLKSDVPLANGHLWLNGWRAKVRTATNKEQLIAEYAGMITLNGTGHSWCVGNARGTGCGGLCVFEAQLCIDCHYGIIGQEHRSVWEGIREQQQEVLALDDIGPGGRARALQILKCANNVLARLDGKGAI